MPPDIDAVTGLIRAVAAEEIMPRFRRLRDGDQWEKRPGSVVTVADTASEARLAEALVSHLPGSRVIGEEGAEEDPAVLDLLEEERPVWIIDPVDGTANFAAGEERFAVIVALVEAGDTRAGWIHDPVRDRTAVAALGEGAWMGPHRLRAAGPVAEDRMTISLGARLRRNRELCAKFAAVTNTACCGIDYLGLADGRVHAAHYRNLKPWDHAAGQLIHGEAGGFSACLDGTAYRPGRAADGGLLLAPDEASWRSVASLIRGALAK